MSTTTSDERLYHELHEFLRSPIWILPVMSFVEQKSLVFDEGRSSEKALKEIHAEFRAIVDMLLGCFCEDLKVQIEDVVKAVEQARPKITAESEKIMVEPVIAAYDYNVFLHMMMRKNIELQLQALQLLEVVYGIVPAVLIRGTGEGDQEHVIMIEVMKKSKEQYENEKTLSDRDKEQLESALKDSLSERERLENEQKKKQQMLENALKLSANQAEVSEEAVKGKDSISRDDAVKRKEYLLKQRDRLLELKRQERNKAFERAESASKPSRPRTARAARTAMAGKRGPTVQADTLEQRKALAEKLRTVLVLDDKSE